MPPPGAVRLGAHEGVQNVYVKHTHDQQGLGYENYTFTYEPGAGLHIEWKGNATVCPPDAVEAGCADLFEWLLRQLTLDARLGFRSIQIWALVMFMLQVAVLILLSFEDPGMEDANGVIRYISDNIAVHKGFGGVMLVAFAGSYLLLSMVSMPATWIPFSILLTGGATFGGAGVVMFHGEFEWQHIGCAACFISCGLILHLIAIFTGPWSVRHQARDIIFILITFASAGAFGGILIRNRLYIEHKNDEGHAYESRDPRLNTWWWVSGVAEYILYINMCVLNVFVGQRVAEHTAWAVFEALPAAMEDVKTDRRQ